MGIQAGSPYDILAVNRNMSVDNVKKRYEIYSPIFIFINIFFIEYSPIFFEFDSLNFIIYYYFCSLIV